MFILAIEVRLLNSEGIFPEGGILQARIDGERWGYVCDGTLIFSFTLLFDESSDYIYISFSEDKTFFLWMGLNF